MEYNGSNNNFFLNFMKLLKFIFSIPFLKKKVFGREFFLFSLINLLSISNPK
jgi:hypothetical protein